MNALLTIPVAVPERQEKIEQEIKASEKDGGNGRRKWYVIIINDKWMVFKWDVCVCWAVLLLT